MTVLLFTLNEIKSGLRVNARRSYILKEKIEMERHAETVMVRANMPAREQGERLLVNGERMAMRLWEREPAGTSKPDHKILTSMSHMLLKADCASRLTAQVRGAARR